MTELCSNEQWDRIDNKLNVVEFKCAQFHSEIHRGLEELTRFSFVERWIRSNSVIQMNSQDHLVEMSGLLLE